MRLPPAGTFPAPTFATTCVVLLLQIALFAGHVSARPQDNKASRPNIILINLDDADTDLFSPGSLAERFPHLNQLALRSVRFNNTHVTTPLCGPSRACLLRAQYAHRCGIRVNAPDVPAAYGFDGGMRSYVQRGYASNDLSTWMQDAGYHTMHVGKFLHHESLFMIPEGWDDFYSSRGSRYFETSRITNRGGPGPYAETLPPGLYRTTAETIDTLELIHRRADAEDGKPFFLYLNPFGPHSQQRGSGEMYEDRYADLWPDAAMPDSPAYDEQDVSDLSGPVKSLPRLLPHHHDFVEKHYRERLLATKSVDDMVGEILGTLEDRGLADNTWIFVTSDNGFALGHHRLLSKGVTVNRSTNVPLLVAGPGVIAGESDHLLAHIDIGPTIVELAGGTTPDFADGVSFVRLIADPQSDTPIRESVLIENFETRKMFGVETEFASVGLRLKDSLYVEWAAGGREYFDLGIDPEQIVNILKDFPKEQRLGFAKQLRTLKASMPAHASFRKPYVDLEKLSYPFELEGIAESSVSTRCVKVAVRDLSTGKFWNGDQWISSFHQVTADLGQRNGMLTTWRVPLEFGDHRPAGLVKAWAWGLDWSNNYDPPATAVFQLDEVESRVTLDTPFYAQRFDETAAFAGKAVSGVDGLSAVRLKVRDIESSLFWDGNAFTPGNHAHAAEVANVRWSHEISLPPGTYRVSVMGINSKDETFDVTHRLFHVD